MRVWFFIRGFLGGSIVGGALIQHFTYRQVLTADKEIQQALEDLANMEASMARRGEERLNSLVGTANKLRQEQQEQQQQLVKQ